MSSLSKFDGGFTRVFQMYWANDKSCTQWRIYKLYLGTARWGKSNRNFGTSIQEKTPKTLGNKTQYSPDMTWMESKNRLDPNVAFRRRKDVASGDVESREDLAPMRTRPMHLSSRFLFLLSPYPLYFSLSLLSSPSSILPSPLPSLPRSAAVEVASLLADSWQIVERKYPGGAINSQR